MNETNFPSLSTAHPINTRDAQDGNRFAQLAEKWATDAEVDRRIEQHKKFQEATERQYTHRVLASRNHSNRSRYERHDDEYDEEDLAPLPQTTAQSSLLEDDVGWTEVRNKKTYKPKRELTIEEMDERERRANAEAVNDEFNGHLFESNRHDHDRV